VSAVDITLNIRLYMPNPDGSKVLAKNGRVIKPASLVITVAKDTQKLPFKKVLREIASIKLAS